MNFVDRLPLRSTGRFDNAPTTRSNNEDKRIRIQLHHNGLVSRAPLIGQRRTEVEEFLNEIWRQFGSVSKTYYDRDFRFVIVTFTTREQAFFAMASLRDFIEVTVAIQSAIGADFERASLSRQMFISETRHGNLLTAAYDRKA